MALDGKRSPLPVSFISTKLSLFLFSCQLYSFELFIFTNKEEICSKNIATDAEIWPTDSNSSLPNSISARS